MTEALKILITIKQLENAIDLRDKNILSVKWVILLVKVTLMIVDHKIIQYFNQFLIIFKKKDKMFDLKSKWLTEESITTPATSDKSYIQKLTYFLNSKIVVKFERNCLR